MAEDVELDAATREEILAVERRINSADDHLVLGLTPGATRDEVKKAYWEASRKFHPDRYFGKRLGSFASRLDRIFRRINEAHQALIDSAPEKRAEPVTAPVSATGSAERDEERRRRMARHPYLQKTTRLNELLIRARQDVASGNYSRAHGDLHLASQLDPKNVEVQKLLAVARTGQNASRADTLMKRSLALETTTDYEGALAAAKEAFASDEKNAAAAARAAFLMRKLRKDPNAARSLAQKAVALMPKSAEYKVLWADLLNEMGMDKLAKRQAEEALELNPDLAEAKALLRKLK
jgi:tetratricopeptide (TPR) repeat protein